MPPLAFDGQAQYGHTVPPLPKFSTRPSFAAREWAFQPDGAKLTTGSTRLDRSMQLKSEFVRKVQEDGAVDFRKEIDESVDNNYTKESNMDTRMNHIKKMFLCGEYSWIVALRLLDALSVSGDQAERFLQEA